MVWGEGHGPLPQFPSAPVGIFTGYTSLVLNDVDVSGVMQKLEVQ